MSPLLMISVMSMILALTLYSLGVWGERIAGRLTRIHAVWFWIGFVCDTTGTTMMGEMAGKWSWNAHSVTGLSALILMAVHAVWATVVLVRGRENEVKRFHTFSLVVWLLWLIPFVLGAWMAMGNR